MRVTKLLAAAALLMTVQIGAQAATANTGAEAAGAPDPFLGRWVLDAKVSSYQDHRCPKRMTITMTPEPRGVHYHSETEPATGETFRVDYVAAYDGKPAVVTGDRGILLPVSLRRDAPDHVVATYTSATQVMARSERTVSEDRRTMRVVTTSHDAFGQTLTNTGVYRREAEAGR